MKILSSFLAYCAISYFKNGVQLNFKRQKMLGVLCNLEFYVFLFFVGVVNTILHVKCYKYLFDFNMVLKNPYLDL